MRNTLSGFGRRTALFCALYGASPLLALAAPITFTWDPSKAAPALAGAGTAFAADTIDVTSYLRSANQSTGSFVEQFILPITGFELGGTPVLAPGLNTGYGLYFTIVASGQAGASGVAFNSLNIGLFADPGANDGIPSATAAGLAFSNGTSGDFLLGSGQFASAVLSMDSAGVRHAHFVTSFAAAPGQAGFLGGGASSTLELFLTTPTSAFSVIPQSDGSSIQLVNGGTGQADFAPEPAPIALIGSGLFAVGLHFRRKTL